LGYPSLAVSRPCWARRWSTWARPWSTPNSSGSPPLSHRRRRVGRRFSAKVAT